VTLLPCQAVISELHVSKTAQQGGQGEVQLHPGQCGTSAKMRTSIAIGTHMEAFMSCGHVRPSRYHRTVKPQQPSPSEFPSSDPLLVQR